MPSSTATKVRLTPASPRASRLTPGFLRSKLAVTLTPSGTTAAVGLGEGASVLLGVADGVTTDEAAADGAAEADALAEGVGEVSAWPVDEGLGDGEGDGDWPSGGT